MACLFGSEPQPGADPWYIYSRSWAISKWSVLAGWVYDALGLPETPQLTATLCASPQPSELPLVTDWIQIFVPFGDTAGAYRRFKNWFIANKWTELCQCSAGSGGTCYTGWSPSFAFSNLHSSGSNSFTMGIEFHMSATNPIYGCDTWFPNAPNGSTVHLVVWNRSTNSLTYQEDFAYAGSGYQRYLFTTPPSLTNGETYDTYYVLASFTNTLETTTAPGSNPLYSFLRPTYDIGSTGHSNTTAGTWQPISPIICTGGAPAPPATIPPAPSTVTTPTGFPSPPVGPSCTTIQDVCNELAIVYSKLLATQTQLDLLQKVAAPSTYATGIPSTGLTGDGSLPVSGILGLSVTLTTVPVTWGFTDDVPRRLIPKVGSIRYSLIGSPSDERQLHYDNQLLLDVPPFTDHIVYSFRDGIVATITPLLLI